MCASSEASGKSVLRVHARGPKRYELDECARVKSFLYMHAGLSSWKISFSFCHSVPVVKVRVNLRCSHMR